MNGPLWRRLEGLAYADLRQIAAVLAVLDAANSSVKQGLGAVRARLRQIEGAAFPPAACQLLASIGDDTDRQRVARLLTSDRSAQATTGRRSRRRDGCPS